MYANQTFDYISHMVSQSRNTIFCYGFLCSRMGDEGGGRSIAQLRSAELLDKARPIQHSTPPHCAALLLLSRGTVHRKKGAQHKLIAAVLICTTPYEHSCQAWIAHLGRPVYVREDWRPQGRGPPPATEAARTRRPEANAVRCFTQDKKFKLRTTSACLVFSFDEKAVGARHTAVRHCNT